jgi:hypothetical protein
MTSIPQDPNRRPPPPPPDSIFITLSDDAAANELRELLQRSGLERTADGSIVVRDANAVGVSASDKIHALTGGVDLTIGPPGLPPLDFNGGLQQGAMGFANNISEAFDKTFLVHNADGTTRYRSIEELNPEELLAAFMKLNINDPNNTVDTHVKLVELMSEMRLLAIEEAKAANLLAEKKQIEAEKKAKEAEEKGMWLSVVMIAASIALACLTMGATAGLIVAACAAAGAVAGYASGGDMKSALAGASMGAAIGSLIAGPLMTSANTAVTEVAKEATKQALEEAAKEAAKQGLTGAAKDEFIKAYVKEQVEIAVKAALEKMATELPKEVVQNSIEKGMEEGGAQAFAKEGAAGATENMVKEGVKFDDVFAKSMDNFKEYGRYLRAGGSAAEAGYKAKTDLEIQQLMIEAQQAQSKAKRFQALADELQSQIEEQNAAIAMIMESKNKVLDAVIAMMSAMSATKMKLTSAGTAR